MTGIIIGGGAVAQEETFTMNEVQYNILKQKKEKNILILAHYYQPPEVQDIADHVCDSFEMARLASTAKQNIIIICGVHFMAESAKILNPGKTVLLPADSAGCPMADMIKPEDVIALRGKHPGAAVVCYVNSSAAVKAVSDICCTSSSAEKIVRSLTEEKIIFVPDRNLGAFISSKVPEKEFIFHDGWCPVHDIVSENDVFKAKEAHHGAKLLVHPECRGEVLKHADFIGSTAGMIKEALNLSDNTYIIGTENGVIDHLQKLAPEKRFYPLKSDFICRDMKKIGLPDVLRSMETGTHEIKMSPADIEAAESPLRRMINI